MDQHRQQHKNPVCEAAGFALRWVFPLATVRDTHSRDEFVTLLRDHRFVCHNLKYGIPLPDSSVDFIFSSHVLHHLYREDALKLIREALRVLKPGGTMRITVPDLELIVALYLAGKARAGAEVLVLFEGAKEQLEQALLPVRFRTLEGPYGGGWSQERATLQVR